MSSVIGCLWGVVVWGVFVVSDFTDVLRGTSLDVYCLLLKSSKPLGIREIQRLLDLSSPSVAQYHLSKLEHAGLLKREGNNFIISQVVLDGRIKIGHFLIPRHFLYSMFAVILLLNGVIFIESDFVIRDYFIATMLIFVLIFCYETAKCWLKGGL